MKKNKVIGRDDITTSFLKAYRSEHKLKQRDIADKLFISTRQYQSYEQKPSVIPDGRMQLLLKLLNKNEVNSLINSNDNFIRVPIISQFNHNSYIVHYSSKDYIDSLGKIVFYMDRTTISNLKYRAFEMHNDSMDNNSSSSYLRGDILLSKSIDSDNWIDELSGNNDLVFNTINDIYIGKVKSFDKINGFIVVMFLSNEYPDVSIDLKDLNELYRVVKFQRIK